MAVCSAFHVYFETDPQRIEQASSRQNLHYNRRQTTEGYAGKADH